MQSTAVITGLLYRKYRIVKGLRAQTVELETTVLGEDLGEARSRLDVEVNVFFRAHGTVIEEKVYTPWPTDAPTGIEYVIFEPVPGCSAEERLLWRCTGIPFDCTGRLASELLHEAILAEYPHYRYVGGTARRAADRFPFRSDRDIPYTSA